MQQLKNKNNHHQHASTPPRAYPPHAYSIPIPAPIPQKHLRIRFTHLHTRPSPSHLIPSHPISIVYLYTSCSPQRSSAQPGQHHLALLPSPPASPPPPQSSPSQTRTFPCLPERKLTLNVRLCVTVTIRTTT